MPDKQPHASRRGFFLTATAASAALAATALLKEQAPVTTAKVSRPAPEKGGGYTLSKHVEKYYKTALV